MTTPAKPAFIEGPVSGAPQPPNLFALFYCFAHSNFTYHSFLFIETLSKLNLYKTFPNADFPNLHDYHCSESRLFGACELAVYDVTGLNTGVTWTTIVKPLSQQEKYYGRVSDIATLEMKSRLFKTPYIKPVSFSLRK